MKISLRKLGIALLTFFVLSLIPLLHAQDAQPQKPESNATQSSEPEKKAEPRNPNAVVGKELVEATKAEEGENDQTTGLKHSTAVQWMARKLGVSVVTAYWIAMIVNFAIIFVAIGFAMKSKLPGYFRTRNEAIQKGILEARAASEDAKRRLAEIEKRLSKLDTEVAQIRATAEGESAAEEARIRSTAVADVERIVKSAEQEIDAAGRQARRDLKGLAAGLAVDLAARKLQVDQATDESLVRDFVSQVGKDGR